MALKFLQETRTDILGKLKSDLSFIDPAINLDVYETMTTTRLQAKLTTVREAIASMKRGTYGSWLREEAYVKNTLLEEAIRFIIEHKTGDMRKERLIPGSSYYTGVARYGRMLEGKRSIYLGEEYTGWVKFRESAAVAKAMTVLRHGTEADFREIYVGMANGRADALTTMSLAHITESTKGALKLIEAFCDSRWTGPWPWEIEAPEKLKHMIETREEKKMKSITEMQHRFTGMLREFEEGNMGQYEMIAAATDMMSQVDSMVSGLAKLSGSGIEMMAQAKSDGDGGSGIEPLQQALGEPLNAAVAALTDLKAALSNATSGLTGGGGGDIGGDPAMDDMGSPADAMGDDPMMGGGDIGGGDDVDALADVDIGGDDEERPMKVK